MGDTAAAADEVIFTTTGDGGFEPTEHAAGPWDPGALHGGAAAALITRAFERSQPNDGLAPARLEFEFLRPIPFAKLAIEIAAVRPGRRVRELRAELSAGGQTICRASTLRVQAVPAGVPSDTRAAAERLPGPERGTIMRFALDDNPGSSFATTGMEMSWLDESWRPGPGRVWMRLRRSLVPGERASPLVRVAAVADFANGVSAELPFDRYLYINADLAIHLWRLPQGEWLGLDSRTLLYANGIGTTESVVHDLAGAVGRAFQTLVVQPR
ncbi:MAG TPA: thioesterase family protein [Solirubrobacteraceae bacterium]|nr:thioesterase family protein [Solirubrobacteraceae bacterium]